MDKSKETQGADWYLDDWERALTINVGEAYACRQCENLVMVTKGGIGVLDLVCCGIPMEKVGRGLDDTEEDGE
jgi:desulfoferrodoxin-like iron-binding protein